MRPFIPLQTSVGVPTPISLSASLTRFRCPSRLLEVGLECLAELVVMRRLRHLRQRCDQLRLGAVQVLELLLQYVLQ